MICCEESVVLYISDLNKHIYIYMTGSRHTYLVTERTFNCQDVLLKFVDTCKLALDKN